MWSLIFVTLCLVSWAGGQNRGPRQHLQSHHGHGPGWDIRLAVPGEPGNDYPTLGNIPRTSFSCSGKGPGYYADLETNCQAFRVCTSGSTYGFQSFLCPNGTLFNQAVVVCDWWMNVNCQKSQEYINNDKFGNLKLGPQLMKDVKKMITHPMRNPYDKTIMKSNLIVMQDYKPPIGQMFPGESLLAGPARAPNSIYVPAKQIQQPYNQNVYNPNGNVFAASTPSPSYVPPSFNIVAPQRDAEVFQRQRQNGQYQSARLQSTQTSHVSNGHAGQFTQNQNSGFNYNNNYNSKPAQLYSQPQRQTNYVNTQNYNQRGQLRQNGQYTDGRSQVQHNGRQNGFEISYQKQQYSNNAHQPLLNDNSGQINTEAKQNLVSGETPATIITKTLTFNKIPDPQPGKPKSRITIKTWIVKPTKAAKLIAEPTAYSYGRPTNPLSEKQVAEATPYVYNVPTTPQTERLESERPYTYNRPTFAAKQIEGPYVYNRPTAAAKQIVTTPSRLYLTPTAPPPTLSRLYLTPSTPPPTVASRLYIPPTTYKPAAKLYIPPSQTNLILSRQYLAPSALQQPAYYQSEQLKASPTSPTPVYDVPPPNENPTFSQTKLSRINTNHNNLTFSDILTKEKLDITVNDIVSDTSSILKTAQPHLEQYREDKSDYSDDSYGSDINNESDEKLTPESPTVTSTSARLVADPSRELEPPVETYFSNQNVVNTNRLATLPFYKEPATNTIERTVSLKISIPEKVATYLFKNNDSNYDKLEILNTGSSNYLVLTNNLLPKNPGASFIPIGRLIADKNTNISNSQALVFNFLADSLNQAKEYSNIATQNIATQSIATPTPAQFQGVNNQELARITNQISQLTASQYGNTQNINNNFNHANVIPATQTTGGANQYQAAKYTSGYPQNQQQVNSLPARLTQGYTYQNANNGNLQLRQNQIYSGQLYQLPVPDVTSHIYNAGSSNLIQGGQQSFGASGLNQNGNSGNNLSKHSNAEVEIVQSQTLPITPAKLQQFTPNDAETFNSQEQSALIGNFINNGNGISAQLQDKIVGTIPHPLEDNKLVTYKKDQSYYVYTKLNNNAQKGQINNAQTNSGQSANLVQNPNTLFSFLPSVSYQLEDEKDQQKILNTFQIDEFGSPKKNQGYLRRQDLISEVDYSVEHRQNAKQVEAVNEINTLYAGPSSYSAPQASVGSLQTNEAVRTNLNGNARLEQLEDNGYSKVTPARQFGF